MESATPVIEEHPSIVEAAVIEESPSVINTTNDMDTAEVNDPVNLPRNNPKTQDHSQNLSLPSDNTTPVIVLICAADRTAALNRSKQFQSSSQLKPHPSNKEHHFSFKTHLDDRSFSKLKKNLNKFEDILMFQIAREKKQFTPDNHKKNHCQECPKYCEEDSD